MQVYGDKDQDGFYWGECRGRRGYVPYNMVEEITDPNQLSMLNGQQQQQQQQMPMQQQHQMQMQQQQLGQQPQGGRRHPQDRWGDNYNSGVVKKMIALYDYDPQQLSPNVDGEVC